MFFALELFNWCVTCCWITLLAWNVRWKTFTSSKADCETSSHDLPHNRLCNITEFLTVGPCLILVRKAPGNVCRIDPQFCLATPNVLSFSSCIRVLFSTIIINTVCLSNLMVLRLDWILQCLSIRTESKESLYRKSNLAPWDGRTGKAGN